jgi:putative MATE family efflux protein
MKRLIRDALADVHRDYTEGDLRRAVLLLAIPMVLEMALESVFAVVDIFWVSRLGADAVTVVGITESLMTIVYALVMGLAMAAGAVVARRVGAKDLEGARAAVVQVVAMGLLVSAVLGVIGAIFAPDLMRLLGASDAVVEQGSTFARIMLGGNVVVTLLFLHNAAIRGAGDAALAMRSLWLANALNIALGPVFVFGLGPAPALGVTGAAVATTIGRGCGVLYQLSLFARGRTRVAPERRHLRLDPKLIASMLRVAWNGTAQMLISTTSWIGLMRVLTPFGSAAVAGYTICIRVVMFAILPAWGLGNAAATLVGQNLGAKKPERAEKAVWIAARYDLYFLGAVGVVLFLLAPQVAGLFAGGDAEVLGHASTALRIIAVGFPFYAGGLCVMSAFNGAGDTWTPTLINFGAFWCFEIPLAWTLSRTFDLGPTGIYTAVAIAFSCHAIAGVLLFRQGRWKAKKV